MRTHHGQSCSYLFLRLLWSDGNCDNLGSDTLFFQPDLPTEKEGEISNAWGCPLSYRLLNCDLAEGVDGHLDVCQLHATLVRCHSDLRKRNPITMQSHRNVEGMATFTA